MTTAHSSHAVTEGPFPSDTGGVGRREPVIEVPGPLGRELFTEPNRDVINYTHIERVNGSSGPLIPREGRLFFFMPALMPAREHFTVLQKWEGYVTEVRGVTFRARLQGLRGEESDQEAEIFMEEVSPEDRDLIEAGAVFYWTIGYLDRPSGRLRVSHIRFRRLPVWSERELDAAKEAASHLKNLLNDRTPA